MLNSLISSISFLVEYFSFSTYSFMWSANKESFTSCFPIWMPFFSLNFYCYSITVVCLFSPSLHPTPAEWMPFISSFCLTVMTRTSSTMLNNKSEIGHPCLVPGLACSFWLNMMLPVSLSYMVFIMFTCAPSIHTLLHVFIINGCRVLPKIFLHLLI